MFPKNTTYDKHKIQKILEASLLSPSVHNTQAWSVNIKSSNIVVSIDKRYVLGDGDPTKRQSYIGLGIFCEMIKLIAIDYEINAILHKIDSQNVEISFHESVTKRNTIKSATKLISTRATDRSIYKPVLLAKQQVTKLENSNSGLQTKVHIITESEQIQTVANLTSQGIELAMSNPDFRKELSHFLLLPWSKRKRGISLNSLYIPKLVAYLEPIAMRLGLGLSLEVNLERKRWESASAVIAITAPGDLEKYWFDVGRNYARLTLAIEDIGLSQATSGAIVEASNYHEDVESILGTNQRILSMIRVGKGKTKRNYSPRVSLGDIISSN